MSHTRNNSCKRTEGLQTENSHTQSARPGTTICRLYKNLFLAGIEPATVAPPLRPPRRQMCQSINRCQYTIASNQLDSSLFDLWTPPERRATRVGGIEDSHTITRVVTVNNIVNMEVSGAQIVRQPQCIYDTVADNCCKLWLLNRLEACKDRVLSVVLRNICDFPQILSYFKTFV